MRLNRIRRAVTTAVTTAVMTAGTVVPAVAFDDHGPGCSDLSSTAISFSGDAEWNKVVGSRTLRQRTEDAHQDWRLEVESWRGGGALKWGGANFQMDWQWAPSGTYAFADCPGKEINFSRDYFDQLATAKMSMLGLATHEMGHMWGLGHAGYYDSFGGGRASMTTCKGSGLSFDWEHLAQDDEAAIQFQTNKSGSYGAMTANPSFEESHGGGWQYWGKQSVTSSSIRSGGVDGSAKYARFAGGSSSTAVYSTTRATDNSRGHVSDSRIKGRANYKLATSVSSGTVLVVSKFRAADFPGPSRYQDCQFRDDMNQRPTLGSFNDNYYTVYCTVRSSWGYCTTASGLVDPDDGVDARVVVYNRVRINSNLEPSRPYTSVDVDRVRELIAFG